MRLMFIYTLYGHKSYLRTTRIVYNKGFIIRDFFQQFSPMLLALIAALNLSNEDGELQGLYIGFMRRDFSFHNRNYPLL